MNILIVDDEKELRTKIARYLKAGTDFAVALAENGFSAKRQIQQESFDLIVTDLDMPGMDGLALLKWIQKEHGQLPVLMMSGYGEIADAVEAMKVGAVDYLEKPFELDDLQQKIEHVLDNYQIQRQIETGKQTELYSQKQKWIGDSSVMRDLKALVERVAPTSSTVLITGESGTGKEIVARMIHHLSPRARKPFIAINIGGVLENLLESELFGHEKGAFTGATSQKIGLFELASSGTLFLDEIGEIPIHLQVKLLRVLQELEIQRLGGNKSIPIDVRIIAATNKDLKEQINKGLFREDLFYRLNIIHLTLPALRERKEDIPALVGHFITKYSASVGNSVQGIEPDAVRALQNYTFSGNVRELENIIERAVIFAQTETITLKDLGLPSSAAKNRAKRGTLDEVQKEAIFEALHRWEGNRTRAAQELGIDRKTLLNKIKEYGFENI
ncbi:sigma-54-dependent Fis family transcriptional regulator [candidate division KSB3 bacterium]|uniref:Sigma-54-dependent Fis family transcriptional regulator n=1 Tax=candidate division KSB3 bacterium TaxID=2044937 RepID=A0A2G6K8Q1_9BACT|nr:MAG: sigma-54-dependent Fis family transcriptional regulator [candidate division KSB3 bacterium]